MKRILAFTFLAVLAYAASAQVNLKPSIGLGNLPADSTKICDAPWYLGDFDTVGLAPSDTAYDFNLYDSAGNSWNLQAELNSGKPVLLIAGSWTCPVFRGRISTINNIVSTYGSQLSVAVIYELEAHPVQDTSVYFGYPNPGSQNTNAGILFRQPTNYGERKSLLDTMLDSMTVNCPVLIDGPCNEFWSVYGPAPNNAYLIDTSGIVFRRHGWFDKYPDDIYCDIDSLLGNPTSCGISANGQFQWQFLSTNPEKGSPGSTIYMNGFLINNSNQNVLLEMFKMQTDLPAGWSSSICTDVCYPAGVDTAQFLIAAGDTQLYTQYFYTPVNPVPDTGRVRMRFYNTTDIQNNFIQNFIAITDSSGTVSIVPEQKEVLHIFPNPAKTEFSVHSSEKIYELMLYSSQGRLIRRIQYNGHYKIREDITGLSPGIYFANIRTERGTFHRKILIRE